MRKFSSLIAILLIACLSACTSFQTGQKSTLQAKTAIAQSTVPAGVAAVAVTPVCNLTTGTTQQVQITSSSLKEPFTFTIYLPPCYSPKHEGGYPILYLFHGQNMDDTYWPALGITGLADRKIQEGGTPFIMVFPYELHNWDQFSQSKFGDAFMTDLVPYVERHYAVCPERSCQALGGLSRGGGWALHIGLTNLEKFGAIGAHSPGYFSGDMYRVETLLQKFSTADFPRIYMDRGEDDYLKDSIEQYEQNLTFTHVVHEYHINPGSHETAYWQSQVQNYLDWYVSGFKTVR